MTEKVIVNKNDQENKESTTTANENDDPNPEKKPVKANGTDGVQLSNLATAIEVADNEQRENQAMESVAALSATQGKTDRSLQASERKIRVYSSGISFKRRCTVKQIPCDQLNALACGKRRISQDDEHRNWTRPMRHFVGSDRSVVEMCRAREYRIASDQAAKNENQTIYDN
uniref:Uncharacterized protein n=1 Tax=Romanomermis culicivorax TaxID=13658 RepID=A0A915KAG4_ROMCU